MPVVEIGSKRHTTVRHVAPPGQGNACHEYLIEKSDSDDGDAHVFASVSFQNGPILEAGVNGCHNEDLIAIVLHRLEGFQAGDYRCRENALAITKLEEALHWLNHRTQARERRGVEGTHTV